jgi:hypothetical protein
MEEQNERAQLDRLPTHIWRRAGASCDREERAECAICMEAYRRGQWLRTLPCLHSYHTDCIDQWLLVPTEDGPTSRRRCPLCNAEPWPSGHRSSSEGTAASDGASGLRLRARDDAGATVADDFGATITVFLAAADAGGVELARHLDRFVVSRLSIGAAEADLCLGDHVMRVSGQRVAALDVGRRLLHQTDADVLTLEVVRPPAARQVFLSASEVAACGVQLVVVGLSHPGVRSGASGARERSVARKLLIGDALLKIDSFPVVDPAAAMSLLLSREEGSESLLELSSRCYHGERVGWRERAVALHRAGSTRASGQWRLGGLLGPARPLGDPRLRLR